MYVGIDIGGTKIQFAASKDGEVNFFKKISTPKNYEDFLVELTGYCLGIEQNTEGNIECIGIGIPATFNENEVIWSPNIQYLEKKNLIKDVLKKINTDVVIGNDAQLSLLGETWKGVGRGKENALLMSIGTGVGGAIMVGGKLIKGRRGAAGALGWVNLDFRVPLEFNHGYLERQISGKSLQEKGNQLSPALSSYEIVERAKNGDHSCMNIFREMGKKLGASLATLASVLDTEIVILSGGLSEVLDLYKKEMEESFRKYAAPGVKEINIHKSMLGNLSGVYGAVRLAMIQEEVWI